MSATAPAHDTTVRTALLEHFRQFAAVFDSMNVIVYVADLDTHEVLFVNPYTESLFGSVVGKKCWQALQAGQPGPCPFCSNHRLVVDGRPQPPYVWEFQNTVTGRWFLCIDRAIRWTDGRLVRMEVAVDITARKEADALREQILSLISHDLRNPLCGMSSAGQNLRDRLRELGQPELAQVAGDLVSSAHRMDALIEELVDTVRLHSGTLQLRRAPVDLAALVRGLAFAMDRRRISVDAPVEPPPLHVDASRFARVVENLLSNALKYSPADSNIEVTVGIEGEEAVLRVRDHGIGIAAEDLPRVFTRFFRASGAQKKAPGLGLGLYGARLIVEAHGGRITVESEPGRGSCFRVALPLS